MFSNLECKIVDKVMLKTLKVGDVFIANNEIHLVIDIFNNKLYGITPLGQWKENLNRFGDKYVNLTDLKLAIVKK